MTGLEAMTPPPGFLEKLMTLGMEPGWKKREPQMWPTPKRAFIPAVWRARSARDALDQATSFVSPEFAERRNLILANPVPDNFYPSCATMVAAYQLVLAGETARSHRHTPNAMRVVLDAGPGMVTLVNGVAIDMAPGDVVLTPQWHWHGHANHSDGPGFWIDILDVPLVQKLENIFFQHHPETLETPTSRTSESPLRIRGREAIGARRAAAIAVGNEHLPTMKLEMVGYLGADCEKRSAAIDNRLLVVVDGQVDFTTEQLGTICLERGDVAVVPSWTDFELAAAGEGVLLHVSDSPVFETLGFRDPSTITF